MTIRTHKNDLSDLSNYENTTFVAVDTETMGLNPHRDRLCVVQLSPGDGTADVVQIEKKHTNSPNLEKLMTDPSKTKIFHYARFDIAVLYNQLNFMTTPIWCTKIASKITRTYTDRHSLEDLTRELLDIEISKKQQQSDWGSPELSDSQINYAASDVLHLHKLQVILSQQLARENRIELAEHCFSFLPTRAKLDLLGWANIDIFAHK